MVGAIIVAGLGATVVVARPSFIQDLIYIAALQALFYPQLISNDIYHFLSVLVIYYLLFPLIAFFDDFRKLLAVSLIPFLFFAALLQFGFTDPMLLSYYALFVGGIIAAKSDTYAKLRRMRSNRSVVLTVLISIALLSLVAWGKLYLNSAVLKALLINFCGVPLVLIVFYWATIYVRIFKTSLSAFFTFVAFSTFGVFFIYPAIRVELINSLYFRFNIAGTTAVIIILAFTPLLVIVGYLLQFLTNKIVNWGIEKKKNRKLRSVQK